MTRTTLPALAAIAAVAIGLGAGPANADTPPNIGYRTTLVGETVVTTIDSGRFMLKRDGRTVDLNDSAGRTVMNLPLTYTAAGFEFPLLHEVSADGHTLKLTPDRNLTKARAGVKPVASLVENSRAQSAFSTQFGMATAIGGFTGTAVGGVLGGLIGLVVAGAVCAAPPWLQCIVTTLPIIASGAGVGAIIGTVAVGGPALAIAGVDLIQTLIAPEGTTKWNYAEPR